MNLTPEEVELVMGEQLWRQCPHCETGQRVVSWKDNPCLYLKCKKTFDVEITLAQIVEGLLKKAKLPVEPKKMWVRKEPRLQRLADCYILVEQGGEWK